VMQDFGHQQYRNSRTQLPQEPLLVPEEREGKLCTNLDKGRRS
ncbi:hypothetical protein AK812_SmicGene48309, partial [Symbiodinium microadriaticum]